MEGNTPVSAIKKIWEMINPFVFFFVCLEVSVFIVYFAAGIVYEYVSPAGITSYEFLISQSVWCYLLFYASALVIKGGRKRRRNEFIKYGHFSSKWKLGKCVGAAFLAVVAAFATNIIIAMSGLMEMFPSYTTAVDMTFTGQSPILLIAYTVIGAPLAEELIFRFMTFGRMRYYLGSSWAIIFSALLFGVYHMNMIQFIYGTVVGIIFAAIYDRSGNIWITIGAHMGINLLSVSAYL